MNLFYEREGAGDLDSVGKKLESVAREVEREIKAMMDEAAAQT